MTVRTTSCWLAVLLSTACADPDRSARTDDTGAEDDGSDGPTEELDDAMIVQMAMQYEDRLIQLSTVAEESETHADAASVFVWGSNDAAEAYRGIDPDDPTQSVMFPEGTTFVKEHFDDAGDRVGLTIMYKGPSGYDPEARDWFWARVRGTETTHAGRVQWCSNCHNAAYNSDFVVGFGKSP